MIAGSTSVQPIAEKLAEHFAADTACVRIEVQGGGSSAGIQAARSGAAEIGMSSRELKKDESDLTATVIAYDAIVLVVNPANPASALSIEKARDIFSGRICDWKAVDASCPSGSLTVLTREEGSGTRGAFEELVMHKAEISDACLVQDSTGALREIIADDPRAIGYISFGALNSRVRPLAIDGVAPSMDNMLPDPDGVRKYKIVRPFLFATRGAPSGAAARFIEYIRTDEGAAILKKEGLIPAHGK